MNTETLRKIMGQFEVEAQDVASHVYLHAKDIFPLVREQHPLLTIASQAELLRLGIMGYFNGATIIVRRGVPEGHYVIIGNSEGITHRDSDWKPEPEQVKPIPV